MTSHMKSRTPKIHFLTPLLDLSFARVMNGVEMQICITSRHLPRAETYKYECPFSAVTFLVSCFSEHFLSWSWLCYKDNNHS